jgi:hypothetical protein
MVIIERAHLRTDYSNSRDLVLAHMSCSAYAFLACLSIHELV